MFLKLGLLFLSLFISQMIYADAGWVKIPEDPTIVRLQDNFGRCTGTRISHQGHILTARHCFNQCLIAGQFVQTEILFPSVGWQSPKLYKFNSENPAVCTMNVDGVEQELEVVFASGGFMTPSEQGSLSVSDPQVYDQLLESYFLYNGDYAVVKQRVDHPTSCRAVSTTAVEANETIYYMGYPTASMGGRPEGYESDGESLLLSRGHRVVSMAENTCIDTQSSTLAAVLKRYDRPEIFLSTIDVLPGASGSSVLNENGEIVAVVNSVYSPRVNMYQHYCSGSAVAVGVERILQHMAEEDFPAQDVFDCEM